MRQVGPPSPFESSDAAYSCTSQPTASSARRVRGLPSAITTTPGRTASTLQPSVSYSSASIGHAPDSALVEQLEQRHRRQRLEDHREVVGDG